MPTVYGQGVGGRNFSGHPTIDYVLLGMALCIDLADVVPLPLDAIGIGFLLELPLSAAEMAFLWFLGVPPVKSIGEAAVDMIPFMDIMPWCTLAVLDKRFNTRLPFMTWLFNK